MMQKSKSKIVIVCIIIILFIGYNTKQVNCLVENIIPTKFIGIPSVTWLRFTHPNYDFSFSYPACWKVHVQNQSDFDFITVSRWIRGNLYTITMFQSNVPDANQDPDTKKSVYIGKKNNIKASYSKISNDFIGGDVKSGYQHIGKGFDKVYSFPVGKNKYISIQYGYEQSVNGKKYTEPDIGRVVADKLVQSIALENSPLLKYVAIICPKCFR